MKKKWNESFLVLSKKTEIRDLTKPSSIQSQLWSFKRPTSIKIFENTYEFIHAQGGSGGLACFVLNFFIFDWVFCSKMNCRVQNTTVTIWSMHLRYQKKHLRIKYQIGLRRIPGTASTGVEQGVTSLSTASCTQEQSGGTAYCRFTPGRYQVQHHFLYTGKVWWHHFFNIEEEWW